MKTVFIYTLSTEEEPDNVRYVGKTSKSLEKRLITHLQPSNLSQGTYKTCWLNSVIRAGQKPMINFVDEVPEDNWGFWERYWIAQFRSWGFRLTNGTEGGDGVPCTKESTIKRLQSGFNNDTIRLKDEIERHNVRFEDGEWIADRICPKCGELVVYKRKNRALAMKGVRKGYKENRQCDECRKTCLVGRNYLPKAYRKKPVYMISLDGGILKEFESASEAGRVMKIGVGRISACCQQKPRHATAGGYKWCFKENPTSPEPLP